MESPLPRAIETVSYPDNGNANPPAGRVSRLNQTIPRGLGVFDLLMRLRGTFRVTSVSDNAGTINPENPATLIDNLQIITDTDGTIVNMAGRELYKHIAVRKGIRPDRTQVQAGQILANGDYAFDVNLSIPFVDHRLKRGVDLIWDTRRYNSIELVITWGNPTSIVAGSGSTLTLMDVNLDVAFRQTPSLVPGSDAPYMVQDIRTFQKDVTVTDADFLLPLTYGAGLRCRRITMHTLQETAIGQGPTLVGVNNILNFVGLRTNLGPVIVQKVRAPQLQAINREDYQLENWFAGMYVLDFSLERSLKSTIFLGRNTLTEFALVLDVTKQANLNRVIAVVEYLKQLRPF